MLKIALKSVTAALAAACLAFLAGAAPLFAEEAVDDPFAIKPLYVFQNKANRDPFVPRFRQQVSAYTVNLDITTLTLLGITTDADGQKAALFRSKSGSATGYVFTGGKLYGDNDEVVSYISGEWKGDRDILLRQGDKEVLFRMAEIGNTPQNIYPGATILPQQDTVRTGTSQANP